MFLPVWCRINYSRPHIIIESSSRVSQSSTEKKSVYLLIVAQGAKITGPYDRNVIVLLTKEFRLPLGPIYPLIDHSNGTIHANTLFWKQNYHNISFRIHHGSYAIILCMNIGKHWPFIESIYIKQTIMICRIINVYVLPWEYHYTQSDPDGLHLAWNWFETQLIDLT